VVYRHFLVHKSKAEPPAFATCAAARQGKHRKMMDLIWDQAYPNDLSAENMEQLARKAGLRMSKYRRDVRDACPEIVRQDQAELSKLGVRGTPAFFINGRYLSGARPVEQFEQLIDEELAKAKDRIRAGTPAKDYYREWVLERGKKQL